MSRTMIFRGKTAIVTGAAGGIGSAICQRLAGYGMNLVLVGRQKSKLEEMSSRVQELGGKAAVCAGDLSQLEFLDEIVKCAEETFGGVDLLINNAGLATSCLLEKTEVEVFDSIMNVNVRAPYFLCQKSVPLLRKSDCATIINLCSVVAHKGYPLQSVYAASKHALLGMTKSLANEIFKDNIRVHAISPGSVYTEMITRIRPDLSSEGMILPEDIADIVEFYLEHRSTSAVIDEIELHRATKEPFA